MFLIVPFYGCVYQANVPKHHVQPYLYFLLSPISTLVAYPHPHSQVSPFLDSSRAINVEQHGQIGIINIPPSYHAQMQYQKQLKNTMPKRLLTKG